MGISLLSAISALAPYGLGALLARSSGFPVRWPVWWVGLAAGACLVLAALAGREGYFPDTRGGTAPGHPTPSFWKRLAAAAVALALVLGMWLQFFWGTGLLTLPLIGLAVWGGYFLFAPPLAALALEFGPPEYFSLTLLGLIFLSRIGSSSALKSFLMVGFGLLLGTVGMDAISGVPRFTFGNLELGQGVELVPVAMGLYGIGEVLIIAERVTGIPDLIKVKFRELFPTRQEWKRAFPPMIRGTGVGFFLGLIPGPAAILSTFASYSLEKKLSRHPEEFGRGAIEGVAGPESANNSATAGSMVPLLALGIPFAPPTALLLGALTIHGVQPGPLLMSKHPEIFWGVVASMYIGNAVLLVLNLPLVGVFASILRLPQHLLMGLILLLCLVGTFSINNSLLDIYLLLGMGGLGYILRKLDFDMAPLILAVVLGPILEKTLRQSLFYARGDAWALLGRPYTAFLLSVGLILILLPPLIRRLRRRGRAGG